MILNNLSVNKVQAWQLLPTKGSSLNTLNARFHYGYYPAAKEIEVKNFSNEFQAINTIFKQWLAETIS